MIAWRRKGAGWALMDENAPILAQLEKINQRWYGVVPPRIGYHLGPYRSLDQAMRAVHEFMKDRRHQPQRR